MRARSSAAFVLLALLAARPARAQDSGQLAPPLVDNRPVPPPVVENRPLPPPVVQSPATHPVVENRPVSPPVVDNRVALPVVQNRPSAPPPVVDRAPRPVNSYPDVAIEADGGETSRSERSGGVFLGGLGIYLVSWGLTALVGAAISDSDSDLLFWPVVGPMLYYDRVDGDNDLLKLALISTIAQSLGVLVAIYGLFEMLADDR